MDTNTPRRKIRFSFDIDITDEHMISGDPITADNACEWAQSCFDLREEYYPKEDGHSFISNFKAEPIGYDEPYQSPEPETLGDALERHLAKSKP